MCLFASPKTRAGEQEDCMSHGSDWEFFALPEARTPEEVEKAFLRIVPSREPLKALEVGRVVGNPSADFNGWAVVVLNHSPSDEFGMESVRDNSFRKVWRVAGGEPRFNWVQPNFQFPGLTLGVLVRTVRGSAVA